MNLKFQRHNFNKSQLYIGQGNRLKKKNFRNGTRYNWLLKLQFFTTFLLKVIRLRKNKYYENSEVYNLLFLLGFTGNRSNDNKGSLTKEFTFSLKSLVF